MLPRKKMRSLLVVALLVGACAELSLAIFYGGYGMGFGGGRDPMYFDDSESYILNCFASFDDGQGNIANEIAVNIIPKNSGDGDFGGGLGYGYGYGFGGMGAMGGMGGKGMGGQGMGGGLSAKIELKSNVAGGTGLVVFTERARVRDGCNANNFGNVLTDSMRGHDDMGMGGMGAMGYPSAGGYGYGGYGYGGFGYGGLGYGAVGYGHGFGMGHGMGSMFDDDKNQGVIAELNITPGAISSAVVDDIGFDDLADLAGRGVVVCSSVTMDWDWNPVCEEPFFSCCSLKYDDSEVSIIDS